MEYSRGAAFLRLLPDSRLRSGPSRISLHQSLGRVPGAMGDVDPEFDSPIPTKAHRYRSRRSIIIMSGSLHPNEIHHRRQRKKKRNKLRARLAAAPAAERSAIEAKLQKTYALGSGPQPSKSSA